MSRIRAIGVRVCGFALCTRRRGHEDFHARTRSCLALGPAQLAEWPDDDGSEDHRRRPTRRSTADTSTTTTAKPAKLKDAELQVMAHYHDVNQMEIDLNKVAAKKATSEGAKAYANMLVKDHTDNDKALMALAKKTGQKIPAEKPASRRREAGQGRRQEAGREAQDDEGRGLRAGSTCR